MNFFKKMCLGTVVSSLALGTGILPAGAQAQQTAATGVELNIPPGPVSRAAIAFSQAAGVQLILDSSVANGVSSPWPSIGSARICLQREADRGDNAA